jgi:hypothetical protein
MALGWPYDERFKNFGPLQPIPSVYLNSQQDVTSILFGLHSDTFIHGHPSTNAQDELQVEREANSWLFTETGVLWIPIAKRAGVAINAGQTQVRIRYQPAGADPAIALSRNFIGSGPGTPPSSVSIGQAPGAGSPGVWDDYDVGPVADDVLGLGEYWQIQINGNAGDRFAGARVFFSRSA